MDIKKDFLNNKIVVIGVGGGGSNMVNRLSEITNIEDKKLNTYVLNTDIQALVGHKKNSPTPIQIGKEVTKGLGAGMKPEIGKLAAEESYSEILNIVRDAEIVFIATGLGGGTGTGAAPVVAKAVAETGGISISVVTKPFLFEGIKRKKLATDGYSELEKYSDIIISVSNEKLLQVIDNNTGIKESFKKIDAILANAVNGLANVILQNGNMGINLDFADIKTILEYKGKALIGVANEKVNDNEDVAKDVLKKAIESPLLEDTDIKGARGIVVNFTIDEDFPLAKISDAMDIVYETVSSDAIVMFGIVTNEEKTNEISATVIITGFSNNNTPISIDGEAGKEDKTPFKRYEKIF